MILILSTPRDTDTQIVIDYLKYNDAPFFRLNDEDIVMGNVIININPNNFDGAYLLFDDEKIFFRDFSIVWFRKFGFLKTYEDFFNKNDLIDYMYSEFSVIRSLLLKLLDNKKWLFKRNNMLSKLEVLNLAVKSGLKTPETLLTSSKKDLTRFYKKNNERIICKSIGNGKHINYENHNYPFFTQIIESLEDITDSFSPSLFQNYIEKKYELRIFYLDSKFYSMVIFSQNNEQTKIDFRNYDFEKPNRLSRYKLPKSVENKLDNLMRSLGLNTGSIDMIKALDGHYYFLEVNPSGQFGMTSIPCNYELHAKVANYLTQNI